VKVPLTILQVEGLRIRPAGALDRVHRVSDGSYPEPVTVTEVPALPDVGVSVMLG